MKWLESSPMDISIEESEFMDCMDKAYSNTREGSTEELEEERENKKSTLLTKKSGKLINNLWRNHRREEQASLTSFRSDSHAEKLQEPIRIKLNLTRAKLSSPPTALIQFLVDPSTDPDVISLCQTKVCRLEEIFPLCRTWCYTIDRRRKQLLGKWNVK